MNRRVNDDVDDALFTRLFRPRSQVDGYTTVDPSAANIMLRSESYQKADRESAILAENGALPRSRSVVDR